MLILHISDIHFRHPFCHREDDPDLYVRNELVAHAAAQIRDLGDVDAILVTGDIAYCGIGSEYDAATEWLEVLAKNVGCNKRRIYVVPGNHDVDRTTFKTNSAADEIAHSIQQSRDNATRNQMLEKQLKDDKIAHHLFASIEHYNLFAAKYDCQVIPGRIRWNTALRMDSRTELQLYGINSSLISGVDGDDTKGDLFLGSVQMGFPRKPGSVNLIMAHHPPEWMSDQNQIEMRLYGTPNIVLLGHRHVQALHRDQNGSIVFSAGSVNPDRAEAGWEPAYNLIELTSILDDGPRRLDVLSRQFRWQSNPNGFVHKVDLATQQPVFVHQIPIDGENTAGGEVHWAPHVGGIVMPASEPKSNEPPTLVAPDVRDLIYRFWELEPRQRLEVLNELGAQQIPTHAVLETMAYRTALVSIARDNRLRELEAAIADKET